MNKSFKIMCLCALLSCPTILGKDNMFNKSTVLASQRKVDKPSNKSDNPLKADCFELTMALSIAAVRPDLVKDIKFYLNFNEFASAVANCTHGVNCEISSKRAIYKKLDDLYNRASKISGFSEFTDAINKTIKNETPLLCDKLNFYSFLTKLPKELEVYDVSAIIVASIESGTEKISTKLGIYEIYNNLLKGYRDCLPVIYNKDYKLSVSDNEYQASLLAEHKKVKVQQNIVESQQKKLKDQQNTLETQRKKMETLSEDFNKLKNKLDSCSKHEQEYNDAKNEINSLKQSNQKLQTRLEEANGEVEALRNTRETLQRRLNKAEEKLSKISHPDHSAPISPVGQAEDVFATVNTSEEYENYAKLNMPIPFNLIGEFLTKHGENQVVIDKAIRMSQDTNGFTVDETTYKGMPVFHKTHPCNETSKGLTLFAILKPNSTSKDPRNLSINDLWLIATGEHIKDDSTKKVYNLKYSVVEEAVKDRIVLGTEISK